MSVQGWKCGVQKICFTTNIDRSIGKVTSLTVLPTPYPSENSQRSYFFKMPAIFTYVLLWFYVVFPVFPSFSARANKHAQSFFSSVQPISFQKTVYKARPRSPNMAEKVVRKGRVKENFKGRNAAVTLKNE